MEDKNYQISKSIKNVANELNRLTVLLNENKKDEYIDLLLDQTGLTFSEIKDINYHFGNIEFYLNHSQAIGENVIYQDDTRAIYFVFNKTDEHFAINRIKDLQNIKYLTDISEEELNQITNFVIERI